MRLLYLSKYAMNPNHGTPTRQFFYCKYFSRMDGNEALLVSSRSSMDDSIPKFKGRSRSEKFGNLENMILNGPTTRLGFNLKRIFSWLWFEFQIFRTYGYLKRWNPDVIMVSSLSLLTFFTGVILKRFFKCALIVEVRDIHPLTLIEVGGLSRFNPAVILLGWIEKLGYRHADAIVSSMPNMGPHVKDRIGLSKSVTCLPMGYDPEYFRVASPSDNTAKTVEKIQNTNAQFSVGYCGTIGKANALNEVLEAFDDLQGQLPDAHLWIVGDGPLRKSYQDRFEHSPNIHFLGHHPKKDLPHLLDLFDVVVNPWLDRSIYRFGISPNKWIDYMFSEKPILVPYGGFRFQLEDKEFGWFIAPENVEALKAKIIELYHSPDDEIVQRGKNGKRFLTDHLSYESLSKELDTLVRKVAGDIGSSAA